MKKYLKKAAMLAAATAFTLSVQAIPALKGAWRMITLADGQQIRVELRGDEHVHFWVDANGKAYQEDAATGTYRTVDVRQLNEQGFTRRQKINTERTKRLAKARRAAIGEKTDGYFGKKKAVIILVQFTDKKFGFGHNQDYYNRIANELNFSNSLGFKGSVKDYFLAQSNGQFELDFDVVGPYNLGHETAYYGGNDAAGHDLRPGAMVAEACRAADADVNFADYDWDGDSYADQVYVLYAGTGEAAGGSSETIWPHEYRLSSTDYGMSYVTEDVSATGEKVAVNTYACGSEMTLYYTPLGYRTRIDGIGTLCHEFSHCLGYADLYDTNNGGNFGMGSWDLMSSGSYNGNSFCPPNFTAYEKWFAGWIEPTVLDKPTTVKGMQTQDMKYGETYIIYNDAHKDEYYLLENRQNTVGLWDTALPGSGLMITHVDFNKDIWQYNNVNSIVNFSNTYGEQYAYLDNDHQRLTIFHADNSTRNEAGDLYPYDGNNSLTDSSEPAAIIYNEGEFMGKAITNITQNADGTISFDFMGGSDSNIINGIDGIKTSASNASADYYDLSGRKIAKPTQRGIYIHQGKKVVVK